MTDEADEAQMKEQAERDNALAHFANGLKRQGTEFCIGCGDLIAEPRRKAIPSATRCVDCQDVFERGI